jgi:DNA-binding XRE family transcriptional regulator
MIFSPAQCRAARALLGWSQQDLERASGVAKKTIADFERGARTPFPRTLEDLKEALAASGIEFTEAEDGVHGAGVRFKWGFGERAISPRSADRRSREGGGTDTPGTHFLLEYWRGRPAEWASLSEPSRRALSQEMLGAPDAWETDFALGLEATQSHPGEVKF